MKIYNIQKLAIFTTILTTVSVLFIVVLQLTIPMKYPDFISGHLVWSATTKLQDLIIMPSVLAIVFFLYIFMMSLFRKLNKINLETSQKVAFQLVLWCLPAISTVSSLLIHKGLESKFLIISLIGVMIISFYSWLSMKQQTTIEIEKISIGLLMVFLFSLAPLGFSVIINIAPFSITGGGVANAVIENSTLSFFIFGILFYIYSVFFNYAFYSRNLAKLILISQLGLSLLFCTIYPARLMEVGSKLTSYETSLLLNIFIAVLVIISLGDIIYRHSKHNKSQFTSKLISPLVIIAIIVAMKFGNTMAPVISSDDYHFGESLLGWWSYAQGYLPYIDYMPSHGLINNDFAGLLNVIFYDGTAASLADSQRLAFVILAGIAYLAVYLSTGSLLISFISIYFMGDRILWLFLIPFAALWFQRLYIENKVKWSIIWFISAPLVILGVPPQGFLLVTASSVIPLYFLWETLKNRDWSVIKPVVYWFLIILVFYAVTPLGEMLLSAIKYLLINGPINQIAYGVPWSLSFNGKGFLFEAIRMSWVIVPAVMLYTLHFLFQNDQFKNYLALPLIVVLLFSLLLIPYSMGRIDPGSLSRPGSVGILLITGFMSLVVWNIMGRFNRIWLIFVVVFLASLFKYAPISLGPLFSSANSYINVGQLRESHDHLLSNIGRAQVQDEHWQRLKKLAVLLDKKLEPNESYLDLTSRNAQYFYLNRMPLIPVTAPYNMASPVQQKDAIRRLEKDLPRLTLLEGQNIIQDGGGLALRNHYLYRFIIKNYEPFEIDGFIIGLSKKALKRGDWSSLPITDKNSRMELFEKAFSRKRIDLRKLPVAWGLSSALLSKKMETVLNESDFKLASTNHIQINHKSIYEVTGHDPFIVLDLSQNKISGRSAGMLKFDFKCYSKLQEPKIQVFWWGDNQKGGFEENSLFFDADDGTVIIPLDALPRWYLLNKVKGLRFDLNNSGACQSFSIKNLSLNERV